MTDVDIDFYDRTKILDIIKHIPAARNHNGVFKKHNTGVYCHDIPYNPLTNAASIDYKEAETRGYLKLDFLNVSIYKDVKDEDHLVRLLNTEPIWELLEQKEFSDLLFQVSGHHQVLSMMKPRSIPQLAAVLAMIRPAKRHLIGKSWDEVMKEIWLKEDSDEYVYKQSHGFAYSAAVVVHMNLICEQLNTA